MSTNHFTIHIPRRVVVVGAAVFCLLVSVAAFHFDESDAEKEIRETIGLYFKGAETISPEYFEQAFALGVADMTYVRRDRETGTEVVQRVPIEDAIKGWTSGEAGETWGKITDITVLDNRLAHVTLDILWSGNVYTDVMAMYRVNDEWKIVNKTFVVKERG